jgi:uncharacterized membrane protein YcaP (DUF421 family)
MDASELLQTALRASVIYVVLLVTIRLLGKRTVGNFTAFDLLVALMLGEIVDEPIFGDVPMAQAIVAIVVIAAWQWVNSWLSTRSETVDFVTAGKPAVLVEHGTPQRDVMRHEHVSERELESMLRLNGIDDVTEVEKATIETNGELSVIKTRTAKELTRGDLEAALRGAPAGSGGG